MTTQSQPIPAIFSDLLTDWCEDRKADHVAASYGWWLVSECPTVLICASPAGSVYTVTVLPEVTRCTCPAWAASGRRQNCKHCGGAGLVDWSDLPAYIPEAVSEWLASLQPAPAVVNEEGRAVRAIENAGLEREAAGEDAPDFTQDPGPWAPPVQSQRERQRGYDAAIRNLRAVEARGATGSALKEAQGRVDVFCTPIRAGYVDAMQMEALAEGREW